MLYKVEVSTEQGNTFVLPFEYTDNGYLVEDIEGLDPVKAIVSSSSFANMDGEEYQSSRRESRNIVVKLGMELGMAGPIRQLRKKLYAFFMPKTRVRLQFFSDDEPTVEIYGIVESCISPPFSQEPMATISILCHKPDFYIPEPVVISGNTVADSTEFVVEYEGSVESGVLLTMSANRALPEFTVYHRSSEDSLNSLEFNDPLSAGDVLAISTVVGAKGATRTRAGSDASVLYGVDPISNYIQLSPGTNYIRVYAIGAAVPFTLTYTTKIGGL